MLNHFSRQLMALFFTAATAIGLGTPAHATGNPPTGDGSSIMMPLMIGLLALSAVLIVVYLVLSARKRKR